MTGEETYICLDVPGCCTLRRMRFKWMVAVGTADGSLDRSQEKVKCAATSAHSLGEARGA